MNSFVHQLLSVCASFLDSRGRKPRLYSSTARVSLPSTPGLPLPAVKNGMSYPHNRVKRPPRCHGILPVENSSDFIAATACPDRITWSRLINRRAHEAQMDVAV